MTHLSAEAVGGCDGVEGDDGGELGVVILRHHQRGGVSRGGVSWMSVSSSSHIHEKRNKMDNDLI